MTQPRLSQAQIDQLISGVRSGKVSTGKGSPAPLLRARRLDFSDPTWGQDRIVRRRLPVLDLIFDRRREGFGQRFFGEVEVSEQPDQGREDPARLVAVQRIEVDQARGSTGRTSMVPPTRSVGMPAAIESASSRSRASTMWKPPNCSFVSA